MINRLSLEATSVSWPCERGLFRRKPREVRRDYDGLIVDGEPLQRLVGLGDSFFVTPLSSESPLDAAFAVEVVDALLGVGPGHYRDGCTPILVCGMDNDVYCGALGVLVVLEPEVVTWQLAWHLLDGNGSVEGHNESSAQEWTLHFERAAYEELLGAARSRFGAVAGGVDAWPFVP